MECGRRAAQAILSALAILSAFVVLHCSAPALPPQYQQAQQHELKGRLEKALAMYTRVSRTAAKAHVRALAGVRRAKILLELGRHPEAVSAYLSVAKGPGKGKRIGARSLYRAAVVRKDRLKQTDQALVLFKRVVDHYPDKVAADDALERIVRIYRARNRLPQLILWLKSRFHRHRNRDVADNLLYVAAQVYEKHVRDFKSAVLLYEQIVKERPDGPLVDDANFHAAALYRKLGKPMRAIVCYQRILSTKADAWVVGSWNSVFLDNSQFQTGMTYLEDIRDLSKAVAAFRRLVTDFPSSTLRDDALWWVALTELRRERIKAALKAHAELRRKFPDSRFAKESKPLRAWAPVAAALGRKDKNGLCAALSTHAGAFSRTWFRKRRKKLLKHWRCK